MPTAQIEVSEQKYDQSRADRRLDAGPPNSLGIVVEGENLAPEPEVDADVGEHGPRERGRGGKDQRAAHHEHDRQEQREQTGDADQDALIERQTRAVVLVGVRLPEIELRQGRRAQLGDIGDGGARVERQPKHIGVERVVALGRVPLAGGDRRDSRRAEVWPEDARTDETKVRRDHESRQLFVQIVGQREDDPGRLSARLQRAHLDAPDDAVGARRSRNLDAIALRAEMLDRASQIDRVGVGWHAHQLHREGALPGQREPDEQAERRQTPNGDRASAVRAHHRFSQSAPPRVRPTHTASGPATPR